MNLSAATGAVDHRASSSIVCLTAQFQLTPLSRPIPTLFFVQLPLSSPSDALCPAEIF
jgi:hypothetical protein